MQGGAQELSTVDGRTLCFQEWGDPTGFPVFSMHGVPGSRLIRSRRIKLGFAELLADLQVRLITYDRPGYGRSKRRPGRVVADSAADVAAIADALGLEWFAVEGASSGSPHALAVAALLQGRVTRAGCIAPMAPYADMGAIDWSRGQDESARLYFACCADAGIRLATELAREDAMLRRRIRPDDPRSAELLEPTRHGVWGWLDDEIAAFKRWGFDLRQVTVPTAIWFDP